MANVSSVRGKEPVKVDIGDGKLRTLKYNLNAFAMLEEKYGSIDEALETLENGSIIAVRFVLWVGLLQGDPEITEDYVGSVIDITDMERIAEDMNRAMVNDLPEKEDKVVVHPNK